MIKEDINDILYFDALERLCLDLEKLNVFQGLLVGFSCEQVHVKGYITLKIVFRADESTRMIKARYIVIDTPYSYYMIIRCLAFNQLGSVMSTLYLCMKYLLPDGWVRDIQWAKKPPWGVIWIVLSWKEDYGYGPCPSTRHTWS